MARFKYTRAGDHSAQVDMTPMLDIVFIMLIFFIVTAVFLDESGLDMTTPAYGDALSGGDTIHIYVDAKNRISVDRIPVTLKGVAPRVERLLADKPGASILVMSDGQASLDPIIYIKDRMNMAGLNSVVKVARR